MNYKILSIVFAFCLLLTMSGIGYLQKKITSCEDSIDDLYGKIEQLNIRTEELENSNSTSTLNYELETIHEQEIALLQNRIDLDENRSLQQVVFYGLIKDSEYEDYVTGITYSNPRNNNLSKVSVSVAGTDNVINFLLHINGESHFAYLESQPNY